VGIRKLEPLTAEVKRLLVASEARGQGLGNQLLAAAEVQARRLGYRTIVLDTDGSDHAALALFRRAGFSDTDDFNGNELARFWFRKDLC
jgi:ribosomal protein S18 acetylase RimI-like enzyme